MAKQRVPTGGKRIMAVVLTLIMCLSFLPVYAAPASDAFPMDAEVTVRSGIATVKMFAKEAFTYAGMSVRADLGKLPQGVTYQDVAAGAQLSAADGYNMTTYATVYQDTGYIGGISGNGNTDTPVPKGAEFAVYTFDVSNARKTDVSLTFTWQATDRENAFLPWCSSGLAEMQLTFPKVDTTNVPMEAIAEEDAQNGKVVVRLRAKETFQMDGIEVALLLEALPTGVTLEEVAPGADLMTATGFDLNSPSVNKDGKGVVWGETKSGGPVEVPADAEFAVYTFDIGNAAVGTHPIQFQVSASQGTEPAPWCAETNPVLRVYFTKASTVSVPFEAVADAPQNGKVTVRLRTTESFRTDGMEAALDLKALPTGVTLDTVAAGADLTTETGFRIPNPTVKSETGVVWGETRNNEIVNVPKGEEYAVYTLNI